MRSDLDSFRCLTRAVVLVILVITLYGCQYRVNARPNWFYRATRGPLCALWASHCALWAILWDLPATLCPHWSGTPYFEYHDAYGFTFQPRHLL